jgi:hypothetical protein
MAAMIAAPVPAYGETACVSGEFGRFDAAAATDGRSFRLADGREVRLAGIEVPSSSATQLALEKMLAGETVVLRPAEPPVDRYGRLLAQAFVAKDGAERWIQGEMLKSGLAQVGSGAGEAACTRALLAEEVPARRAKRGVWANSAYAITASDDLAALLARRGQFTIAEGKIWSVRESGGTIYINFGRTWSRNLTVTILRRNKPAFDAAGMNVKKLEGARVRVRGWIEERNGPRMEAVRPEQIEMPALN